MSAVEQRKTEWVRGRGREGGPILGWFENDTGIITLTEGLAHVVHRGKAFSVKTPPETFSSNPDGIVKQISRFLR